MTPGASPAPGSSGAPGAPAAERRRGYARWEGTRTAQAWRWWVIARGNLGLALANKWVKFVLAASLIPGIILSGVTYFFIPLSGRALDGVLDASVLFAFLVAAIVGARLVSEDRRQGAFLAHFSRPVTRIDYMAGKFVALALPLLFVTTASGLVAIGADAAVDSETVAERLQRERGNVPPGTPGSEFLAQAGHMDAALAVIAFGLVASATTAGIVLGISALATRTRIAGVVWFAVVALGGAAHGILGGEVKSEWPALLSWLDGLQDASTFILQLDAMADAGQSLEYSLGVRVGVLAVAAVVGLVVVHEQLRRAEGGAR